MIGFRNFLRDAGILEPHEHMFFTLSHPNSKGDTLLCALAWNDKFYHSDTAGKPRAGAVLYDNPRQVATGHWKGEKPTIRTWICLFDEFAIDFFAGMCLRIFISLSLTKPLPAGASKEAFPLDQARVRAVPVHTLVAGVAAAPQGRGAAAAAAQKKRVAAAKGAAAKSKKPRSAGGEGGGAAAAEAAVNPSQAAAAAEGGAELAAAAASAEADARQPVKAEPLSQGPAGGAAAAEAAVNPSQAAAAAEGGAESDAAAAAAEADARQPVKAEPLSQGPAGGAAAAEAAVNPSQAAADMEGEGGGAAAAVKEEPPSQAAAGGAAGEVVRTAPRPMPVALLRFPSAALGAQRIRVREQMTLYNIMADKLDAMVPYYFFLLLLPFA
jgi:hypothetical protein